MPEDNKRLQQQVDALEREVAALKQRIVARGVRRRSSGSMFGLPLYEVAMGPDLGQNEVRGHARAFIAIGDIATGVIAIGGLAPGFIAVGGLAIGAFAWGGGAIGFVAVGGGAIGYYACGGGALGKYVISAMEQDPEAVRFFGPWIPKLLGVDHLPPPPPPGR